MVAFGRLRTGCLIAGIGACLGVAGCMSGPTLPLPPPGQPTEYAIATDRLSVSVRGYGARPGARVLAKNATLSLGAGVFVPAESDGHYALTIPADFVQYPQNLLQIWTESGGDESDHVDFLVPPNCARPFLGLDGGAFVSTGVVHQSSCADLYETQPDSAEPDTLDGGGLPDGEPAEGAPPVQDASSGDEGEAASAP